MSLNLRIAARTDVGRVRRANEDAFIAADLSKGESYAEPAWTGVLEQGDRGLLLAVSDGMGGLKAGEVASRLVVSSLARALADAPAGAPGRQELVGAVECAHQTVLAEVCARHVEMGATLTAVYFRENTAYVAEVGDSRAYLIRAGHITQLTKDQSYVQLLVDVGAVRADVAQDLPSRNIILQAMGNQPRLSIAMGRLELRHLDCLVLCSDGLTTKVSDDTIRDVILAAPDLSTGADRLVDLANERGGEDNVTIVLGGVAGALPLPDACEPLDRTFSVLEAFTAPPLPSPRSAT